MFQAIILCNLKENKWAKLEKKVKHLISSPILGPQFFLYVLCLLDVRHCSKLLLYAISRKTYDQNSRKWQKTSFWVWFRLVGLLFFFFFFSKLWFCQSLDIIVSYHHVQYQRKLMIRSLEHLVTGTRTYGRTDSQTSDGQTPVYYEYIWHEQDCILFEKIKIGSA